MIEIDTDKVKVGDSITVGGEYRLIFSAIKKVDACGRKVLYLKTERVEIERPVRLQYPPIWRGTQEGFFKKLFNFFKNDEK